jgi:hypothetical protein
MVKFSQEYKLNKFKEHFFAPPKMDLRNYFVPNKGSQEKLFVELLNCELIGDKLKPVPYQNQFSAIYFRAGIGSGKTFSGASFCHTRSEVYPNAIGLISSNNFPQLRDSTLRGLAKYCHEYNIDLQPCGMDYKETARKIAHNQYCKINGVWHDVKSSDAFAGKTEGSSESGRGTEYGWAWLDEYAYAPQSAFETIQGRMRWNNINPHILITSTINRNNPYNWTYDLFDSEERTEAQRKLFISIAGSTIENAHNLSDGYVERLEATLSPELFAIEVQSEYVSISIGRIFKYFNRLEHCGNLTLNQSLSLHLSFDFNWSPACCVIGQKDGDKLLIIKEFYLENADTFILADTVIKWVLNSGYRHNLFIHGDASGSQHTANSKTTNWAIIWDCLTKNNLIATRKYKKANPSIVDSINSVNCLFSHQKLFIDSQCKELIKDFESLQWKDEKIDKSDIKRSHLADCARYLTHDLFPYGGAKIQFKQGTWY